MRSAIAGKNEMKTQKNSRVPQSAGRILRGPSPMLYLVHFQMFYRKIALRTAVSAFLMTVVRTNSTLLRERLP
jgi:hypothetical protein